MTPESLASDSLRKAHLSNKPYRIKEPPIFDKGSSWNLIIFLLPNGREWFTDGAPASIFSASITKGCQAAPDLLLNNIYVYADSTKCPGKKGQERQRCPNMELEGPRVVPVWKNGPHFLLNGLTAQSCCFSCLDCFCCLLYNDGRICEPLNALKFCIPRVCTLIRYW